MPYRDGELRLDLRRLSEKLDRLIGALPFETPKIHACLDKLGSSSRASPRSAPPPGVRALAKLAGLVGSDADNLRNAIQGETYEATTMYPGFAHKAAAAGDQAASKRFEEIGHDEQKHREAFQAALNGLEKKGAATGRWCGESYVRLRSLPGLAIDEVNDLVHRSARIASERAAPPTAEMLLLGLRRGFAGSFELSRADGQ